MFLSGKEIPFGRMASLLCIYRSKYRLRALTVLLLRSKGIPIGTLTICKSGCSSSRLFLGRSMGLKHLHLKVAQVLPRVWHKNEKLKMDSRSSESRAFSLFLSLPLHASWERPLECFVRIGPCGHSLLSSLRTLEGLFLFGPLQSTLEAFIVWFSIKPSRDFIVSKLIIC